MHVDVNRRPTIGWVNELFLRERTKTSRNVTISFSLTFKARPSPERATATRGRGPLVVYKIWEPRRLRTLWASTAYYKDSFTCLCGRSYSIENSVTFENQVLITNVLNLTGQHACSMYETFPLKYWSQFHDDRHTGSCFIIYKHCCF
jgi:hypothetical protein